MFSFLTNIPQVTKNILLINVMLSIVTFILGSQNIDLGRDLGAYYMNSPLFRPYQIVTHFFMHDGSSIMHLFMNMYLLVILGSYLERLWGPKNTLYYILFPHLVLLHCTMQWECIKLVNYEIHLLECSILIGLTLL